MSAGQKHREPSLFVETPKIRATLHRLLTTGHAPALMRRWQHLDLDHDCPYLAGYNVMGDTRFLDRDFVRALLHPGFAEHILGAPIDTGMSPDDTIECILEHEAVEKVIQDDPDNPLDLYDQHDEPGGMGPHEYATFAEHELVKQKGGKPHVYERGLERIIKFCEHKPLTKVRKDYACAPLLDDPDSTERRILQELRRLGVVDAFKVSKETVDYGPGHQDHCSACANWQGDRGSRDELQRNVLGVMLRPCAIVDGLVANSRWCNRFKLEGTNAKADQATDSEATTPRASPAGQGPGAPAGSGSG